MAVTQQDLLLTLTYFMGESSIPTAATESRKNFIQRTLEEVYRAYPWSFASVTTTLTFTNGQATMPDDFDDQHKVYSYKQSGSNQYEVKEINFGDQDLYEEGDNKFWMLSDTSDGYTINTKDGTTSVTIKYQSKCPMLSANTNTSFADQTTVALGAKRYVKLGQNPDADVSQDEALFQKRLTENIAAANVNRPLRKHRSRYASNGYRLGE
jgi:hypothetical protein